jgi:hypothetical protein
MTTQVRVTLDNGEHITGILKAVEVEREDARGSLVRAYGAEIVALEVLPHEVEEVWGDSGIGFATCSCGWESPYTWDTGEEIRADWSDNHLDLLSEVGR